MNDTSWIWLAVLGVALVCTLYIGASRAKPADSVVPIIQRRRELQDELASLASAEMVFALLREESHRRKKPSWDIEVLTACVQRARVVKERYDERNARKRLGTR